MRDIIDQLKKTTDEWAATLEPDGDWEPMLFVCKDKEIYAISVAMAPQDQREIFFGAFLPNLIKKVCPNPDSVIMLTSAWMSILDEGEDINDLKMMPSEDPNREECVLIDGVSEKEEVHVMGKIIRSENAPELEWSEPQGMEGRLIAALRRAVWT